MAVTFSRYYREITGFSAGDGPIAAVTLMGLTAINCFGVRAGSNVQSALMLLKTAAIAAMVGAGILWGGGAVHLCLCSIVRFRWDLEAPSARP